jgi:type VI secretion system protein ImpN
MSAPLLLAMIKTVVEDGMDQLVAHFASLMECVRQCYGTPRPADQQRLLLNQLRNALDRAASGMDVAPTASNSDFIAGTFAVDSLLYRGATSEVHKLRHRDLGSIHALKTLRTDQAALDSAASLLRREAEIGLSIRDPHLVETSALLRMPDGRPAILQPWSGDPLSSIVRQETLGECEIRAIMESLLLALISLHQKNYIHCDVTPANIFITHYAKINLRLGDFGIALKMGERHADLNLAAAYSSDYCAPEQTSGHPAHPTMDIYSAGRVLYRLLADGGEDKNADFANFAGYISATKPSDRPQTAQLALAELRRL